MGWNDHIIGPGYEHLREEYMNDAERKMWVAVKEADEKFGVDGAGGTKTWIRDYLAPAMEKHGIRFTDGPCPSCASLRTRAESAEKERDEARGDIAGESTRLANKTVAAAMVLIKSELDKIGHAYWVARDESEWERINAENASLTERNAALKKVREAAEKLDEAWFRVADPDNTDEEYTLAGDMVAIREDELRAALAASGKEGNG